MEKIANRVLAQAGSTRLVLNPTHAVSAEMAAQFEDAQFEERKQLRDERIRRDAADNALLAGIWTAQRLRGEPSWVGPRRCEADDVRQLRGEI